MDPSDRATQGDITSQGSAAVLVCIFLVVDSVFLGSSAVSAWGNTGIWLLAAGATLASWLLTYLNARILGHHDAPLSRAALTAGLLLLAMYGAGYIAGDMLFAASGLQSLRSGNFPQVGFLRQGLGASFLTGLFLTFPSAQLERNYHVRRRIIVYLLLGSLAWLGPSTLFVYEYIADPTNVSVLLISVSGLLGGAVGGLLGGTIFHWTTWLDRKRRSSFHRYANEHATRRLDASPTQTPPEE